MTGALRYHALFSGPCADYRPCDRRRATFPFYMNDEQKRLFLNTVYENLVEKLDYEQYLYDIKLAVLNEYVEFIEADEDDDRWYYNHARELAREILAEKEGR